MFQYIFDLGGCFLRKDCFALLPMTDFCNKQSISKIIVGLHLESRLISIGFTPGYPPGVIHVSPLRGPASFIIDALWPNFFWVATRNDTMFCEMEVMMCCISHPWRLPWVLAISLSACCLLSSKFRLPASSFNSIVPQILLSPPWGIQRAPFICYSLIPSSFSKNA